MDVPVAVLTTLSRIHEALGPPRTRRRRLAGPILHHLGRAWLRASVLRDELTREDDVTVVIGTRNRSDYRVANTLASIRDQAYPPELVRIIVVDYGSELASARRVETQCEAHGADYVRVNDTSVWSRARCLNVGIRIAVSKFLMASDVDIVLSPRYVADAVGVLNRSAPSVVCSAMLDLPEDSVEALERAARGGDGLQLGAWRARCQPRYGWASHPSICISFTAVFQLIGGLDEYYEVWGAEDDDLMRRFTYLGLEQKTLDPSSFYLHQWHPSPGVGDEVRARATERNRAYFARSHSIVRNGADWGSVVSQRSRDS